MAEAQGIVGRSVGDRVILGAVIALAILWVMPVAWVALLSFKSNSELMMTTGSAFRLPYTLKNYSDIVATSGVFHWFLNSVIVSERRDAGDADPRLAGGLWLCANGIPVQEDDFRRSSCSASRSPNRR